MDIGPVTVGAVERAAAAAAPASAAAASVEDEVVESSRGSAVSELGVSIPANIINDFFAHVYTAASTLST